MPDHDPSKSPRPLAGSDRHMSRQIAISLRRAYQAELDAPVPDHLQRLVEALHRGLKENSKDSL